MTCDQSAVLVEPHEEIRGREGVFDHVSFASEINVRHPELEEVMVVQGNPVIFLVETFICQFAIVVENPQPESYGILLKEMS